MGGKYARSSVVEYRPPMLRNSERSYAAMGLPSLPGPAGPKKGVTMPAESRLPRWGGGWSVTDSRTKRRAYRRKPHGNSEPGSE